MYVYVYQETLAIWNFYSYRYFIGFCVADNRLKILLKISVALCFFKNDDGRVIYPEHYLRNLFFCHCLCADLPSQTLYFQQHNTRKYEFFTQFIHHLYKKV